jgi:DNA (cytosine-5)-methyltransferase 1
MRALDLFCCAGGATKGLQRAGFHVTGVDIKAQPRYCGDVFIQGDALNPPVDLRGFDFIWASPICQKHTTLAALHPSREYLCFIPQVREILINSRLPWVIENVPKAPLERPSLLCGSSFGLQVRRHRHFESNFPLRSLLCRHTEQGQPIDVSGTGSRRLGPRLDGGGGNSHKPRSLAEAREAIGIDWMSRYEISQAIPPAYAQFIGEQAIAHIAATEAAL